MLFYTNHVSTCKFDLGISLGFPYFYRGLICCLYNVILCYQLLQFMVINYIGMYYIYSRVGPVILGLAESAMHALCLLLFTDDIELIL